jgi:hypothetical protein
MLEISYRLWLLTLTGPRLWQNLRASRETELAAGHPIHVICAWIGNTELVAARHYLQVTSAEFERGKNRCRGGAKTGAASSRGVSHRLAGNDKSPG